MPQITALKPTARDPQRISVYVDGNFLTALNQRRVGELDLRVGQAVDDALAKRVHETAAFDHALRIATDRLARKALTEQQVSRKLRERGCDAEVIPRVLERLRELRLVDDEAFGRAFIQTQQASKPIGPALLRAKLSQRGVNRELIDRLLEESAPSDDEQQASAQQLVAKKLRTLTDVDEATRRRRLLALLARRGFDSDTAHAAVDAALRHPSG